MEDSLQLWARLAQAAAVAGLLAAGWVALQAIPRESQRRGDAMAWSECQLRWLETQPQPRTPPDCAHLKPEEPRADRQALASAAGIAAGAVLLGVLGSIGVSISRRQDSANT